MKSTKALSTLLVGMLLSIVLLTACGGGSLVVGTPAVSEGRAKSLTGAGATFPYPLYSKWFYEYYKLTSVQINYQSIGSGGGIRQLIERTVDFGASDAPMTDEQLRDAPGEVLHIPTVIGAVVVAYNLPGVPTGLKLTPNAVAGIFLGQIAKWNDPEIAASNPGVGLPDSTVTVVHRSDGSGTTNIFTDYLSSVSPGWKARVGTGTSVNWPVGIGGKGNEGVTGQLTQVAGAVGYVELAYAVQNKLSYAHIRNLVGEFIEPTVDSITAAAAAVAPNMPPDLRVSIVNATGKDAYPIAGFTYILVYKEQTNPAKGRVLADFLWWAIHEGERYAEGLLYAPLPPEVVARDEAQIKTISYQGKSLFGEGA